MVPGTERVTAADVKRAAQQWLQPETAFRLVVRPAAKTGDLSRTSLSLPGSGRESVQTYAASNTGASSAGR